MNSMKGMWNRCINKRKHFIKNEQSAAPCLDNKRTRFITLIMPVGELRRGLVLQTAKHHVMNRVLYIKFYVLHFLFLTFQKKSPTSSAQQERRGFLELDDSQALYSSVLSDVGFCVFDEFQGGGGCHFPGRKGDSQLPCGIRFQRQCNHGSIVVIQHKLWQDADSEVTGYHGDDGGVVLG